MFIGHFATALAAKRVTTRPSLGWYFAACQLPDLLWPVFVLAGVEHFRIEPGNSQFLMLVFDHYPWSHSLAMDAVWAAALGGLYFLLRRDRRGALVVGALVLSHWVLDWVTHRPDMPLAPGGGPKLGLGLWNSVAGTVAVEALMFVAGVLLYARATTARDRIGRFGFWILIAILGAIAAANIVSPPPPSVQAVAISALGMWLFVALAAWIDRHRSAANPPA